MAVDSATLTQLRGVLGLYPELRGAYLFGSVAAGEATFESDLDLAVESSRELTAAAKLELVGRLAVAIGRSVDLLDLRRVGEPLLGQILEHGVRLCGSDEAHAALMFRHVMAMTDFVPYRDRLLAERRRRWIGE